MKNIVQFPTLYRSPDEALESAKGWDFETVLIIGHTKEGGSAEGGTIISCAGKGKMEATAKDLLFLAEVCKWQAMTILGYK